MVLPVGQTDEVQQLIKIEKTDDGPSYSESYDVIFCAPGRGAARGYWALTGRTAVSRWGLKA